MGTRYAETEELQELLALRGFTYLRSGKVREIFGNEERKQLVIVSTNRISGLDVVMNERIPGKGKVLNLMSAYWFDWLEQNWAREDIPFEHHLIDPDFLDGGYAGRASLVRWLDPLPIECIVRGLITGSFWKAFGKTEAVNGIKVVQGIEVPADMRESEFFPNPLFTPSTKAEKGHDEPLTEEETRALLLEKYGFDVFDSVEELSIELFKLGREHAKERGLILADTKAEFCVDADGNIVLGDEVLTPDASRYSFVEDYEVGKPLVCQDKQILRDYLDKLIAEGKWDGEYPAPPLPDELVEKIEGVYPMMFERITGQPLPS